MSGKLDDKDYIFALLTALAKRAGGELRLTQREVASVSRNDVIALLYDTKTDEVVLRVRDYEKTQDLDLSTLIFSDNGGDDGYEN